MQVLYFQSASGRKYVEEDILALPPVEQVAVLDALEDLEKEPFQQLIAAEVVKPLHHLADKVFELIVIVSTAGHRIFFVRRSQVYWLLHMIKKKTNKTPPRDIEIALKRAKLIP